MPSATHPQAQFVPISPEFDLAALIESSSNFDYVTRLSTEKLREHSIQSFEALVLAVVIQSGKPLVIEDWGESLPPWLFSRKWLEDNCGTKPELVRDIPNETNIPMTMGHYLRSMGQLTKQFSASSYRDAKRQRLYLKDIDCPDAWGRHLKETIPECIYYLNECIESRTGGDGAILEPNEYGQMRYGKGVAPAGDLMSSLPAEMRALNMMCYVGHEGTYTAAHREMCATLGHNIMVEASKPEIGQREGSSIWFMTETKEREVVSEYFLSMLGHDIEVEKHFAQVNAWKKAPFNVWVVEQKVGDLILIPPLAPHQVWNRGTRTMKAAWNRTTVDTLELALHEALPRARMVCRDEQYKCKAIIYYTLINYYELIQRDTIEEKMWKYGRIKQLLEDFKRLFFLYQEVLVSEMFSPKLPEEENVEMLPYDSFVTCSYCRCNIFNRFLTCKSCILHGPNGAEDTYDVCMDCYAMGRSCACISNLSWCEQWDWNALEENYEQWRTIVVRFDGYFDSMRSPQPLGVARKRYGKKPIAEVCQEQLKLRPWTDITKPKEPSPELSEPEPEVDDEGRIKKRKGKRGNLVSKKSNRIVAVKDKTHSCHICFHQEWNWKLAFCTTCNLAYCYGVLWRAFDLMPQTVMEDKDWQCPRCLKICSCAKCRKGTVQKPYQPKGTLLGHDTRKVADYRSVESLVDFSKTNLTWLRDENADNPRESARMKKLKEKAEADKAQVDTVDESYMDGALGDPFNSTEHSGQNGDMDIDPSLRDPDTLEGSNNGTSQYQSIYANSESIEGSSNNQLFHGVDDAHSNDVMLNHHGSNVFEGYQPANADYAPVAPMIGYESSYPDPSHVGRNRMMGIGYYQQGSGIDQIVYDAPSMIGLHEDSEPARQSKPTDDSTLSLSDLMDPSLQPVQVSVKKRKRYGEGIGSGDEDDVEFFTSKKQRKLAKSKTVDLNPQEVNGEASTSKYQPPPRSVVKPQTYIDLGEDAVPIEEDEGPSTLAYPSHKSSGDKKHVSSDNQLERRGRPRKLQPKDHHELQDSEKRRSLRGQHEGQSAAFGSSNDTVKKVRPKSAWLVRKEAEEAGNDLKGDQSSRGRRRRIQPRGGTLDSSVIDISSAENDEDDESDRAALDTNDDELDSLFGEPIRKEQNGEEANEEGPSADTDSGLRASTTVDSTTIKEPVSVATSKAATRTGESMVEKSPPKRRGRPPKIRSSLDSSKVESASPAVPNSAPPRMLTLKEKLALKGKSFKIVARSVATIKHSPISTATPSTNTVPPGTIIPMTNSSDKADRAKSKTLSPMSQTLPVDSGKADVSTQQKALGPTVVRLVSPDSEVDEFHTPRDESESDSETDSDSDSDSDETSSDDDDIPAYKPSSYVNRGGGTIRGRPGMARRGRPPKVRV